jgi:hypothetical protein
MKSSLSSGILCFKILCYEECLLLSSSDFQELDKRIIQRGESNKLSSTPDENVNITRNPK